MTKNLIIIALIVALVYLYYQNKKLKGLPADNSHFEWEEPRPRKTALIFDDNEELIAERDQAIRSKNETEAELLSVSNKLRNKQSEVTRKETELERLKQEKSSGEVNHQKQLKEKNGLITTLQREINQHKEELTNSRSNLDKLQENYHQKVKLLDELQSNLSVLPSKDEKEMLENNKLEEKVEILETKIEELEKERKKLLKDLREYEERCENGCIYKKEVERLKKEHEKIEQLEQQISELNRPSSPLPGSFPGDQVSAKPEEEVKKHQDQLRKINLLFDENAKDYKEIDFNGLYELLKGISERERERERERESRSK